MKEKIKELFLRNIGVESLEQVTEWFKKSYSNEYRIDGLTEAVKLALSFKEMPVTIVGDYDADGITSTTILVEALRESGFTNVDFRIPRRFSEGFGINPVIIDEIKSGLVITCDNGVAQVESIKKAKAKGLTVIIIDHHMPFEENGEAILPDADVIIDPNAIPGSADFSGYCGAGLSLRFVRELGVQLGHPDFYKKFVGLAAIGTVADVMTLREENYVLVKNGLKFLNDERLNSVGLSTLVSATGVHTAHDIGFNIGPVINAASRMKDDGATSVVNLLLHNGDKYTAVKMTENLLAINNVRKGEKREAIAKAEECISLNCMYGDTPLVLYLPNTPEGIIGIVAGNLCEKYRVPAIVFTDSEEIGVLKGSARSCGNCNIKQELDNVATKNADILTRYGGHEGAAGLSIYKEKLGEFRALLSESLTSFVNEEKTKSDFDIEIEARDIPAAYEELSKYEPYGEGNAPIVFKVKEFVITPVLGKFVTRMGDGSIVKLNGSCADAIGFDMRAFPEGVKKLDLVGSISVNHFNGKTRLQVEFSDYQEIRDALVSTSLADKLRAKSMSLSI